MLKKRSAFISYRRQDGFSASFPERVRDALLASGFERVYLDTKTSQLGEHYEYRIHREIAECDLFIALIGSKWLEIATERSEANSGDIVEREIRAGLSYEKDLVPLLVDGAPMPAAADLPAEIEQLHFKTALAARSDQSTAEIVAALTPAVDALKHRRKLGAEFFWIFTLLSLACYYLTAFEPHRVGVQEYGGDSWFAMAPYWAGLFIWPVIFLPFALAALYRPVKVLIEGVLNAVSAREAFSYLTPVLFGLVIVAMALALEINSKYQAPWTVHPGFANAAFSACKRAPTTATDPALAEVVRYDADRQLRNDPGLRNAHWVTDTCWPNAFFYLISDSPRIDPAERARVQAAFEAILLTDSMARQQVPFSQTFWAFSVAFGLLILLGAIGAAMAVFFVVASIRSGREQSVRRAPSEDAYLCLTFAFVSLMFWTPFRMVTNFAKYKYYCPDLGNCAFDPNQYLNDFVIGAVFAFCYACMAIGLIFKHKRLALGAIGAVMVAVIVGISAGLYVFREDLTSAAGDWRVYLAIAVPAVFVLMALWFQFDPSVVRFNDFRKKMRSALRGSA